jgi:hypothetical protein
MDKDHRVPDFFLKFIDCSTFNQYSIAPDSVVKAVNLFYEAGTVRQSEVLVADNTKERAEL